MYIIFHYHLIKSLFEGLNGKKYGKSTALSYLRFNRYATPVGIYHGLHT